MPLGGRPRLRARRPIRRVERHPQRSDAAVGRDDRHRRRVPRAGGLLERQHARSAGSARHVRARQRAASPAPNTTDRSPSSPIVTTASGSTAPTTSSCDPTGRSGSPTPPTASTATTKATAATSEIGACNVYRYDPGRAEISIVADDFVRPNGLAFSLDESQLYIVDTRRNHIRVFPVDGRRASAPDAVFAECTAGRLRRHPPRRRRSSLGGRG